VISESDKQTAEGVGVGGHWGRSEFLPPPAQCHTSHLLLCRILRHHLPVLAPDCFCLVLEQQVPDHGNVDDDYAADEEHGRTQCCQLERNHGAGRPGFDLRLRELG
jgi:hypothetical protein